MHLILIGSEWAGKRTLGNEIAKYLQVRLNAISGLSEKGWKVKLENKALKIFFRINQTNN